MLSHFLRILERNQDSPIKEEGLLPQDHTQSASETQLHGAEETEVMTVNLAVNCKCRTFFLNWYNFLR